MLSVFPALLDFTPLAPFILRWGLALSLLTLVVKLQKIFRSNPKWLPLNIVSFLFIIFSAILLILGLFTQVLSLVIIFISIVLFIFQMLKPKIKIIGFIELIMICTISLALVFTGAGILAIDLPL